MRKTLTTGPRPHPERRLAAQARSPAAFKCRRGAGAFTMVELILVMVLVCALATPAMAEKVLRWASQGDALTYDPHSANESPTILASQQVYETLAIRNPKYEIVPCLATSWKALDPKTWEFKLRQGVTFHDDTPFTAEDVAFTITRAKGPT
jgi:peptide/nickel transport system substrate-binding protein